MQVPYTKGTGEPQSGLTAAGGGPGLLGGPGCDSCACSFADLEDSYETDSSSLTGSVNGTSHRCVQGATVPDGDADAIPVTFIGEVLDDPVESGLFSDNKAESFDLGSAGSRPAHPPLAQTQVESPQQHGQEWADQASAPPRDAGEEVRSALSGTCKDVNPARVERKVPTQLHRQDGSAEKWTEQSSGPRGRTQTPETGAPPPVKDKEGGDKKDVSAPPSWYQRGQNPGGSFGLKYGLTTYKIVPPRSEMRCYDRGVSLSTGAIKIDELGNLVSPHVSGGRTVALPSSALGREAQPTGEVRGFRGANSREKHAGRPTECSARGPPTRTPTTPAKSQQQGCRLGAEPGSPEPTATLPPQPSRHQGEGRHPEGAHSQPRAAASCHTEVPAAHTAHVPFLKPQRRTSSQYVASAIAKRMGPARAHVDMARKQDGAGKTGEGGVPELRAPRPTPEDSTRSLCPEPHMRKGETTPPCGHLPNSNREDSAGGAQPRAHVSSAPGRLSAQDCPAGAHRGPDIPPVTARRDQDSGGTSRALGGKHSTGNHRTSSAGDPRRALDSTSAPLRSGDDWAPGRSLVNGSRWAPDHREPPPSPRASSMGSHAVLEQEGKPSVAGTDTPDADGTLPPSIFGPKKKFRPVVQRPAPKDTSLHSALMEAIHSAGGKDRLRKVNTQAPARRAWPSFHTCQPGALEERGRVRRRGHAGY